MLMIAEIRKPGLKKFLEELIIEAGGETKQGVRILDLQDSCLRRTGQAAETNCIVGRIMSSGRWIWRRCGS